MKLLRLLLVPFALLVVAASRLGLPLRFGMIWSNRMGHMAGNMECYLCEREAGLSRGWDFWYHGAEPCSEQLAKMLGRVVRIDPTPFTRICAVVNKLFTGWERHNIDTAQVDRDIHNLFEKQAPHLSFTPQEKARGQEELLRMGIPRGARWVCLIVRDGAKHPHLPYHSYRNSDVAAYEQAALALAERGYYVVRTGAKAEKKMGVIHPRIIDMATNGMYSDFRHIYLLAHCAFALSNGTGPDAICVIFRRPVCYVNYVPMEYLQTYHRGSLAIWKHHEKEGKRMTPAQIYASGAGHFMRAEEFAEAGITLVDNTPQEIKDVALEMASCLRSAEKDESFRRSGYEVINISKQDDQHDFWHDFPRGKSAFNDKPLHGEIHMRIGAEFLKQYAERLPELYRASPEDFSDANAEQWARAFGGD